MLVHFLHSYTYFWILESSGAVTTGIFIDLFIMYLIDYLFVIDYYCLHINKKNNNNKINNIFFLSLFLLGVLQALRAVTVFFFSSYFFCEIDNAQCLTIYKIESCLAVVVGVLFYSFASRKKEDEEELDPEQIPLNSVEKLN